MLRIGTQAQSETRRHKGIRQSRISSRHARAVAIAWHQSVDQHRISALGSHGRNRGGAKKKHRLHATIAREYGINPYQLTHGQLIGLEVNLPRLKAVKRVESGDYDPTDYEAVYHLWLTAFEDENQAREAQSVALSKFVEKKCGKL